MAPDRRREELLRLLEEIERIPERPVGSHLDEEDLIGLARGSLSEDREIEVFEHIRSCAECAEDALHVPDVLDAAAEARERRAAAAAVPATADPRAVVLVWAATTAVWVARHQRRGIVRLSGSTADSEQHPSTTFEWMIVGSGTDRILSVRTRDREWFHKPVNCVVKDTRNWDVAEAWVMLVAEDDEGHVSGTSLFRAGAPTSQFSEVEVKVYKFFDQLESVTSLRRAFSQAAGAERQAWEKWLESEVESGRLTRDRASAIAGR